MTKRRCEQIQCSFYQQGGCKNCEECKTETLIINTSCCSCLSCENVPNMLRWGDNSHWSKIRQLESQMGKNEELESEIEKANKIILEIPPEK